MTETSRPASPAEIAATAHLPKHKQVVTVATYSGRATVGNAKTVHVARITEDRNCYGESIGRNVDVTCGAERYRNARSRANICSNKWDVDCAKCAH